MIDSVTMRVVHPASELSSPRPAPKRTLRTSRLGEQGPGSAIPLLYPAHVLSSIYMERAIATLGVASVVSFAFAVGCSTGETRSDVLQGPAQLSAAATKWHALQGIEDDWLRTFAPRHAARLPAQMPFTGASPDQSRLANTRLRLFDELYSMLEDYIRVLPPGTPAHARARFRQGLYADIRLRSRPSKYPHDD